VFADSSAAEFRPRGVEPLVSIDRWLALDDRGLMRARQA